MNPVSESPVAPVSADWKVRLGFVATLVFGLIVGWLTSRAVLCGENVLLLCYVLTFSLGALTGVAEIFPKYKDDPVLAASCFYGVVYLLLNGFVSLVAFAVIWHLYRVDLGMQSAAGSVVLKEMLKYAVLSGLAAMALLRSRLFKVTMKDGREVSVGPDHIVSTLLESTDAYIDRHRAAIRAKLVEHRFGNLAFATLHPYVVTLIFGARQTLTIAQQEELGKQIAAIEARGVPDREKSLQLGFLVVNYLGEDFVRNYSFSAPVRQTNQPAPNSEVVAPKQKIPVPIKKITNSSSSSSTT